jgi:phage tail sheath gpL-like
MARCKNVGGALSDGDRSPPRLTEVAHGKRKKIVAKKRKRTLTEAEIAQAVIDAADLAERGGRGSGIHIGERRFHLEGQ